MSKHRDWNARKPILLGFVAATVLVAGIGVWAASASISGAVIANGRVEVENRSQVVQHPDGGVVGEILARDGDTVAAGDVLLRLDGTFLRSELAIVEGQLAEFYVRTARLSAERDDAKKLDFGPVPEFSTVSSEVISNQATGQENLFAARNASLAKERNILAEQAAQIERQIDGIKAQLASLGRQLDLILDELADVEELFEKGLVQVTRLTELQREEARLLGEIGRLDSQVAQAETRIAELGIQELRLTDRRREEAITQLRDLRSTENELGERRIALLERLGRLDVRAPVSGTIFGSTVLAEQSVVQSAEPMMFIVPGDQPFQVTARVDPIDVDQVYSGQEATLVFSAFNRRTTPEVAASVTRISADAKTDQATSVTFFEATLNLDAQNLDVLGDLSLRPGMPVEVYIRTEDRTPLAYMVQPLTVYFQRAFREE